MGPKVSSVAEWLGLVEPVIPIVRAGSEKGTAYTVHKVGFLGAPLADCRASGLVVAAGPGGKCVLPTAVVEFDNEKHFCRLPVELGPWVLHCVELSHMGALAWPSRIEFGVLNGKTYAEFLV